jgi:3-oxoacyl-[acyl-carrier protein] reductase
MTAHTETPKLLEGKIAVVTGSSRGIGAATVKLFARAGAAVVVHGRDEVATMAVRDDIERLGGSVMHVLADLTAVDQIEELRTRVEDRFGPLDILVANAGGNPTPPAPIESLSEADWRAAIDANLTATFLTIRSFLPGMKSRKTGSIITLSSAAARRPHPSSPIAYAAAKAGIQMLTQHVAAQAGPYNIRVNCLAPETILTERNATAIPSPLQAQLAEFHPLKRLGTPDDVAHAALFLASSSSDWITGMIVDISGGAVMRS